MHTFAFALGSKECGGDWFAVSAYPDRVVRPSRPLSGLASRAALAMVSRRAAVTSAVRGATVCGQ